MSLMKRALAVSGAVLALVVVVPPVWANGRYPAAGEIAIDPADPNVLLVRATFGLLLSNDGGRAWSWVCENAAGYGGVEDPMVAFTADGTLLAGTFSGLSVSTDRGCDWHFAGGALANRIIADLAVEKADPSKGLLIASGDAGGSLTALWETADNGQTWTQADAALPPSFLGITADIAPSDRNRIYVSGRLGPPDYPGVLVRSDDRGATWQTLTIPGSDDMHLPYIGAIDPFDPGVVYVRVRGDLHDTLLVTKDGGKTWVTALEGAGILAGFAVAPDGTRVAIGGEQDGLWTGSATTLTFAQVSSVGVRCLTWAASGLYACADENIDHFTVGLSTDEGKTFTPRMHRASLCGPPACAPSSSVATTCPAQWPAVASAIGANCGESDAGAGGSGAAEPAHGCACTLLRPQSSANARLPAACLMGCLARVRRRRAGRNSVPASNQS